MCLWHNKIASFLCVNPVDTRRRLNVNTTSYDIIRRRINVETTSCVYWVHTKNMTDNSPVNLKTGVSRRQCVCVSGGKKCSFFEKFGVLFLLETPVLRFALLPYYRQLQFPLTRFSQSFFRISLSSFYFAKKKRHSFNKY